MPRSGMARSISWVVPEQKDTVFGEKNDTYEPLHTVLSMSTILMSTIIYHGTKKKKKYSVLLSLCNNNNRKNLLWCYAMQFTKYLCTYYGHLSSQAISSLSLILSGWLSPYITVMNTEWSILDMFSKELHIQIAFAPLILKWQHLPQIMLPCQRLPCPYCKSEWARCRPAPSHAYSWPLPSSFPIPHDYRLSSH